MTVNVGTIALDGSGRTTMTGAPAALLMMTAEQDERIIVYGNAVQVGDVFEDLWFMRDAAKNRIDGIVKSLRPYKGTLLKDLGEGTQIASFLGSNVEMTLPAKSWYSVKRPKQ